MPEDTTPQDRVQAFVEAFRELRGNKPNQSLIQMISNRHGEAAYLHVDDLEALLQYISDLRDVVDCPI